MRGHAFISYVRDDAESVDHLQRALEAAGIPVWRDTKDLWPGEDWRARIRQAITDESLVFIACFSDNSERRDKSYQREELLLAAEQLRLRRPDEPWLIPVRLSDCRIPHVALGGERDLDSLQRVDLFDDGWRQGCDRLIAAVHRILQPERKPDQIQLTVRSRPPSERSQRRAVGRVRQALDDYLVLDAAGQPAGWCHNLQRPTTPTPTSTAYGIKARLLIDDAQTIALKPLGQRLLDLARPDGGWGTSTQVMSRPEVTAIVADAIARVDPAIDLVSHLDLLEATVDEIAMQRTYVMATVLNAVVDLRPASALIEKLVSQLLACRQDGGDRRMRLWCEKTEPGLAAPVPSVVHTAHAICALARSLLTDAIPGALVGEVDDALGVSVEWLSAQQNFDDTSEILERSIGDWTEVQYLRHFTAAWVLRALILAGEAPSAPAAVDSLTRLWDHYSEEHSLWRWSNGDVPIWMTYEALEALRLTSPTIFT